MSKASKLWSSLLDHRIHHPLPLSKQDSQRLLNSIKSSFRAQLEKEHGPIGTAPTTASTAVNAQRDNVVESSRSFTRPTDQHLHTILTNPLFNQHQKSRQTVGSSSSSSSSSSVEKDKLVFEQAVARGLMTIPRAHGFLLKVAGQKRNEPPVMKLEDHGVGTLVLEWLRASGQHRGLQWTCNEEFAVLLVRFLIAEGLGDLLWVWLEQLVKRNIVLGGKSPEGEVKISILFRQIIRANSVDHTLENTYRAFLTGRKMLEDNPLTLSESVRAWNEISWFSTVLAWKYPKVPVHLFEPFVALQHHIRLPFISRAHLNLHHPESPSLKLALEWFRGQECKELDRDPFFGFSARYRENSVNKARRIERLTSFAIDTAQHLLLLDREEEARGILKFVDSVTAGFKDETNGLGAI